MDQASSQSRGVELDAPNEAAFIDDTFKEAEAVEAAGIEFLPGNGTSFYKHAGALSRSMKRSTAVAKQWGWGSAPSSTVIARIFLCGWPRSKSTCLLDGIGMRLAHIAGTA